VTDRSPSSTLPEDPTAPSKRRVGYAITTALLTLLMGLVVVDATGGPDVFGVDTATVRDEAGELALEVRYATVSRPAIATPFDIRISQPGGFDLPVRVAVDASYLRMWDENGLVPAPASETAMGPWLVWEFDPPIGDTLTISYDARIEPAAQSGREGAVAVLGSDDAPIAEVSFHTRVWP
jgi:hypothetical protein